MNYKIHAIYLPLNSSFNIKMIFELYIFILNFKLNALDIILIIIIYFNIYFNVFTMI